MASEWVGLTSQEGEEIWVNLAIASSMHRDENLTCIWFHADAGENGKIRVTQTIEQILELLSRVRRALPKAENAPLAVGPAATPAGSRFAG
jgi:hypothetical protein